MLKIASRYGLNHNYQRSTGAFVRFLRTGSNHDEDVELPKNARIVICGSGLAGSSLAYHLSLADLGHHVVMLERGTIDMKNLESANFSTSSGLVGSFKNSAPQVKLGQYSVKLLDQLTKEGFDIGWEQRGALHLARHHDRMLQFRKMKTQSEAWMIKCELMSPDECKQKCSIISDKDLIGGLFVKDDGIVDKEKLRKVLLGESIKRGVTLVENCGVTKILNSNRMVEAVETTHGTIECIYFVNAAGFWSRAIGQLSEPHVKVPLHPVSHQFVIAQTNPEIIDKLNCVLYDLDGRIYMREFKGKLLGGGFERNAKPAFQDGVLPDSPKKRFLIKPDYDQFSELLEEILNRVPAFKDAELIKLANIPEIFSPDARWILGESPEIRNYYVAAGMMVDDVGGGIGKALADILMYGYAHIDHEVEVNRFLGLHNNRKYLKERVKEIHSTHYGIQYPNFEYEMGRKLRMSPIFPALQENGAVFGQIMGYERPCYYDKSGNQIDSQGNTVFRIAHTNTFGKPEWFGLVESEYRACRERIGLADYSSFTKIDLWSKGTEIVDFLQYLCSNDVDIPIGNVCHTGIHNEHSGGYENDCSLARLSENHYMMIAPTIQQTRCKAWIRKNLPAPGKHSIHINDVTSSYTAICILGPFARKLLSELTDTDLSPKNFPFFTYKELDVGLANGIRTFNVTHTGELGYVLYIPNEFALHVYTQLWEKGQKYQIKHAGYYATKALRVEKFYAMWGQDLDTFTTPLECGRTWRVKFEKNFIGRDALLKQKEEGVKRLYVQLLLDDHDPDLDIWPTGNEPIYRNGELCGRTSTTSFGYTLKKQVCLGYVRNIDCTGNLENVTNEYVMNGDFEVEICGIRYPAKANLHSPNLPSMVADRDIDETDRYLATRHKY